MTEIDKIIKPVPSQRLAKSKYLLEVINENPITKKFMEDWKCKVS